MELAGSTVAATAAAMAVAAAAARQRGQIAFADTATFQYGCCSHLLTAVLDTMLGAQILMVAGTDVT